MAQAFTVGLVDDHPIVREGIANVVRGLPQARLAFSYGTPEEAETHLGYEAVDLVLLDLSLAHTCGLTWLKRFRGRFPELKLLMLTVSDDEASVCEAIRAGACGYLLKDSDCQMISAALHCVRHDIASVAPASLLPTVFRQVRPKARPLEGTGLLLTEREKQILSLVGEGKTNKEIGERLKLTEATVKKYCSNAMTKLSARRRETAAMMALQGGLIAFDAPRHV